MYKVLCPGLVFCIGKYILEWNKKEKETKEKANRLQILFTVIVVTVIVTANED